MICTVVNSNPKYVEMLKVLLVSLRDNSPDEKVSVYLMDMDKIDLSRFNPNVIAHYWTTPEEVKGRADTRSAVEAYMAIHARGKAMLECMESHEETLVWLDADVIVRDSLRPLYERIGPNEFHVVTRKTRKLHAKLNIGVIGLSNTPATRSLMADYVSKTSGRLKWMDCQRWFHRLLSKSKEVTTVHLSRQFHDVGRSDVECFLDDSIIWHCKANHFENKKYQYEYLKYLEMTNVD